MHKFHVSRACFKVGLIKQGLIHDLSKYSPIEFWASGKYFQGGSSPIDAEKKEKGYSLGWQHHKGRNPHHWHYWTDFENGKIVAIEMPARYLAEMMCDWIGAGKAYFGKDWTYQSFKDWYVNDKHRMFLCAETQMKIEALMSKVYSESDIYKEIKKLLTEESS